MSECHHCSMPLPGEGTGENAWQASTVTANGWSMRVRCALCARDMSAETKDRTVLRLATQDPLQTLVVISDEQGNLTTDMTGAVFLEAPDRAGHPRCNQWSRAFTNRAAFDAYVSANPKYQFELVCSCASTAGQRWQILSRAEISASRSLFDVRRFHALRWPKSGQAQRA